MCYSAEVETAYEDYVKNWGADLTIKQFYKIYYRRQQLPLSIPKGMDFNYAHPKTDDERAIKALIDAYNAARVTKLETELFAQKTRLNGAVRALATKPTKKAAEDQRIATNKIDKAMLQLADLRRTEPKPRDSRIFPGWYAPVMIVEDGVRKVLPMRYQCRPAGKPAFYDTKYPGTYNARLDNLEGFWKGQFGHTHGLMLVRKFYENVARHDMEHRELGPDEKPENVVLEFTPDPPQLMLVACLWSRWVGEDGEELLSFAAITHDPPAEVAEAGHDRVIIQIKPEHVDAWLSPDPNNLEALYAILAARPQAFYEHRLAA